MRLNYLFSPSENMSASEYVTILGLEGQFLAPRSALMEVEYFQGMLRSNPTGVYLPFTKKVIREILGVVVHENSWTIQSDDPNVLLGLYYCGLVEDSVERFYPGTVGIIIAENREVSSIILPVAYIDFLNVSVDRKDILYKVFGEQTVLEEYMSILSDGTLSLKSSLLDKINQIKTEKLLLINPRVKGKDIPGSIKITFKPLWGIVSAADSGLIHREIPAGRFFTDANYEIVALTTTLTPRSRFTVSAGWNDKVISLDGFDQLEGGRLTLKQEYLDYLNRNKKIEINSSEPFTLALKPKII